MIPISTRKEYSKAVREEFQHKSREEMVAALAHCWRKNERLINEKEEYKRRCLKNS